MCIFGGRISRVMKPVQCNTLACWCVVKLIHSIVVLAVCRQVWYSQLCHQLHYSMHGDQFQLPWHGVGTSGNCTPLLGRSICSWHFPHSPQSCICCSIWRGALQHAAAAGGVECVSAAWSALVFHLYAVRICAVQTLMQAWFVSDLCGMSWWCSICMRYGSVRYRC